MRALEEASKITNTIKEKQGPGEDFPRNKYRAGTGTGVSVPSPVFRSQSPRAFRELPPEQELGRALWGVLIRQS